MLVDPGSHTDPTGKLLEKLGDLGDFPASISVRNVLVDFHDLPLADRVGAEAQTPQHIASFVAEARGIPPQRGSITNLVDIGNAHGDRRYYENVVRPGDEVYLLGTVRARDPEDRDGNVRLRPETAVVEPADEPFVLSTRDEDALLRGQGLATAALAVGALSVFVGLSLVVGVPVPGL